MSSSAKRVLVPIADDSEEIETTCITDTLTRFGAEVVVASVKPGGELLCKMSRGVKVCKASGKCVSLQFPPNKNVLSRDVFSDAQFFADHG
jgi:putative intracellular protease/amidase